MTPAEFFAIAGADLPIERKVEIGRHWIEHTCAALARDLFEAAARAPKTAATLAEVEAQHRQLVQWRSQVLAELERLLVPPNRLN